MTVNLERSIHPDLLEEYIEQANAPTTPSNGSARRRRRGDSSAPPPESPSPTDDQEPSGAPEGGSGELTESPEPAAPASLPEWLAAVDATSDPREKLRLLVKNVPRDEMEQDDTLRGWLGDYANQRARKMLDDQERQRQDKERQQAFDRGDLYTLGQIEAAELQNRRAAAQAQAEAALNPYMVAITSFQRTLPEAVQRDVQGRSYAPGGTAAEGFQAYLHAVHESAIRHGLEEEVRKREPALRKAELSATVGGEMTPELDGGPAQQYREITDAQVAAMTLEEYDRYFDDKGRPRPGVRVRLERGIDVRREQRR